MERSRTHGRAGRARLLALLAVVTLTAGSAIALDASPAAPEETDAAPLSAYTYWRHGGSLTCQLAKIPDVAEGGTIKPIGPLFSIATDGCPDDLAVRDRDIDDDGEIELLYAVIDPCEPTGPCDAPPPTSPKEVAAGAADDPVSALGAANSFLVTIDPDTGARTTIGALGFGTANGMLTFDEDGRLLYYAASLDVACLAGADSTPTAPHQCLYQIDPSTGAPTLLAVGPAALTNGGVRRALVGGGLTDCDGRVYLNVQTSTAPLSERLARVNTTTGALSPAPETYGPSVFMTALGRDPSGEFWGIGFFPITPPAFPFFKDFTYEIDQSTGDADHVEDQLDIVHNQDTLFGMEFNGDPCEDPPDDVPVTVPVVVAEPTFTG